MKIDLIGQQEQKNRYSFFPMLFFRPLLSLHIMLEGAFHKSSFMHESQAIYLRLYEQFPIQAFIFLPFLTHSRSRIQADFSLVLILRKWEGKCGFPETPTVNLLPQLISNYQDQWVECIAYLVSDPPKIP